MVALYYTWFLMHLLRALIDVDPRTHCTLPKINDGDMEICIRLDSFRSSTAREQRQVHKARDQLEGVILGAAIFGAL